MPFDGAKPLKYSGLMAGAGLTAATVQYRYVKISADNTCVLCSATTDKACGVLQAPVQATGDPVDVVSGGESFLQAGGSVTAGDTLSTTASGQAQTAVTGQYAAGLAVNVAGATTAGTLITVMVDCMAPAVI
jgi:hypothetical protein